MLYDLWQRQATLTPASLRKYPYKPALGCCPFWYYATSRGRSKGLRSRRQATILATG